MHGGEHGRIRSFGGVRVRCEGLRPDIGRRRPRPRFGPAPGRSQIVWYAS